MDDQGLTKEYACIYSPRMHFTASCLGDLDGRFRFLKTPDFAGPPAQRDPAVIATVTEMLRTIEAEGMDAGLRCARDLDRWNTNAVELDGASIARSGDLLDPALREALELGA